MGLSIQDRSPGDEFALIDFFILLWQKKTILIITTVSLTALSGIILFLLPDIYRCSMIINPKPLPIDIDEEKNRIITEVIDGQTNIKALIEAKTFNKKIQDKLKSSSETLSFANLSFNVKIPKKTNYIEVDLFTEAPAKGKQVFNFLLAAITEHYQSKISSLQDQYEYKIDRIDAGIAILKERQQKEVLNQKEQLDDYVKEIVFLSNEKDNMLMEIKDINQRVINQRDRMENVEQQYATFLDKSNSTNAATPKNDKSYATFFNTINLFELRLNRIQEMEYYFRDLLNSKRQKMAELDQRIKSVDSERKSYLTKIDIQLMELKEKIDAKEDIKPILMEFTKPEFKPVELIKPPTVSRKPVRPKRKLIISLVFVISFLTISFAILLFEQMKNIIYRKRQIVD